MIHLDDILEVIDSGEKIGFCLACESRLDGVESNAHYQQCEVCGAYEVFGAEELWMRGDYDG